MSRDDDHTKDNDLYGAETFAATERELRSLDDGFAAFLRRRLAFWAIRWTIGFALTWAAVATWPNLSWLWWVAGITALLSLAAMIVTDFVIKRKIRQTTRRIADAKAIVAEFDNRAD